jgi:hypothetical protein
MPNENVRVVRVQPGPQAPAVGGAACALVGKHSSSLNLLLLEALARELQGPAVFRDGPHDMVGCAGRDLGLDL